MLSRQMLKFELNDFPGSVKIPMPLGAVIRHVEEQDGVVCIWAECFVSLDDKGAIDMNKTSYADREFIIYGTGQHIPDGKPYAFFVATIQSGPMVWHIFELPAE